MSKSSRAPLSEWAEYWLGFPTILFFDGCAGVSGMVFFFAILIFVLAWGVFDAIRGPNVRITNQSTQLIAGAMMLVSALVASIFAYLNNRRTIFRKNQADWELAQRLYQTTQKALTEILRSDTSRVQLMRDREAWRPIQLHPLPDQKIIGDITGYMRGFAFFILHASFEGHLVGDSTGLPWGEGGWVILQRENGEVRLAWLSTQSLLNTLRGFEEKIRRSLPWNHKLELPLNNLQTRLAYGSYTDYALREIFRGEESGSLTAYIRGLRTEVFYNQLAGVLNNPDRSVLPLRFSGEIIRAGVVLAFDVQLGKNLFVLFPAQFFQEIARGIEQATGVILLPETGRSLPLLGK